MYVFQLPTQHLKLEKIVRDLKLKISKTSTQCLPSNLLFLLSPPLYTVLPPFTQQWKLTPVSPPLITLPHRLHLTIPSASSFWHYLHTYQKSDNFFLPPTIAILSQPPLLLGCTAEIASILVLLAFVLNQRDHFRS